MRDSVRRFFVSSIAPTFAVAALLFGTATRVSAATIAFAGFESTGDTWLTEISGFGGSLSGETGLSPYPAGATQVYEGSRSFQTNNGTAFVDFVPLDISGFDSVQITLHISSTSGGPSNGNDGNDYVKLYVALDGAAFPTTADLTLTGSANAQWSYNATNIGSTTAGTVKSITSTTANPYATLVITIPNSALSMDFRIEAKNDNSGEFWNIDSVSVTGVAVPEPSVAMSLIGGVGMLLGLRRMRRLAR